LCYKKHREEKKNSVGKLKKKNRWSSYSVRDDPGRKGRGHHLRVAKMERTRTSFLEQAAQ
jgi:hypothetical protein